MTRLLIALVGSMLLGAVLTAPTAFAAGATTQTMHFHDLTQTMATANPCSGALGIATTTANGVMHTTVTPDGTMHDTSTVEGTFVFVPIDSTQPSYTGHFTRWDGDNVDPTGTGMFHFTFTIVGKGSDGSTLHFHETAFAYVNGSTVTFKFDKVTCG